MATCGKSNRTCTTSNLIHSERWKQVSSADPDTLSKHKIKEIWHLITYDNDLSDDNISHETRR